MMLCKAQPSEQSVPQIISCLCFKDFQTRDNLKKETQKEKVIEVRKFDSDDKTTCTIHCSRPVRTRPMEWSKSQRNKKISLFTHSTSLRVSCKLL